MYKLSLKPFNKIQWLIVLVFMVGYCPLFFSTDLSMLSILLFSHYITLICNHIFMFYENRKVSMTLRIMPNLVTRLGPKKFINQYLLYSFLEMIVFSFLIYGTLAIFQLQGMFDFEWRLLPMALLLNTGLYAFFTICFCLKIFTTQRLLNQILTFLPIIVNVVFHYMIIPSIYEPIYSAYSQLL